ncbi:MAG: hypothetical protein ACTSQO_02855 [Candidatus Helarchaeota archaeon]
MAYVKIFSPSDLYLILTTVLATLLIQMGTYFFIKWRKYDEKLRLKDQVINLSMSLFFMFWGFSNIVCLPFDLGRVEARFFVLKIDLLFFIVGTFSLIYTIMKILEIQHKKFYLTILIASIIFVLVSQNPINYIWYYSILSSIIFMVIIYFIYKTNKIVHGITKKRLIPISIGFLIFSTSYIRKNLYPFITETLHIYPLNDLFILNLGKSIDILGMLLISLGFYTLDFAELKWKNAINNLLIINNGGICLYHYKFTESIENDFDRQLAAGAIMGVQSILGEILDKQKTEHLEVIDYKGKKIIFSKGKYVNAVLIADQDLDILHDKLKILINDIELQFKKYLEKNLTQLNLYYPIKYFIEDVFQIQKAGHEIFLDS